ncbi:hypothetical protein PR048_026526 [Dryococelus australis]|uniref:Uncharacterized protein n=1 Tax=Dryococelus australis TaxID=614101 RepID=A0ABQ9GLK8_9NEOP|nr:hypothetical protein PR048_026526 [Dryococelus australis]
MAILGWSSWRNFTTAITDTSVKGPYLTGHVRGGTHSCCTNGVLHPWTIIENNMSKQHRMIEHEKITHWLPKRVTGMTVGAGTSRLQPSLMCENLPVPRSPIHCQHPIRITWPQVHAIPRPRSDDCDDPDLIVAARLTVQVENADIAGPNFSRPPDGKMKKRKKKKDAGSLGKLAREYCPEFTTAILKRGEGLARELHLRSRKETGCSPHTAFSLRSRRYWTENGSWKIQAGVKGRGEQDTTQKTRRPAASSGTTTCQNPGVTRPGIEPGSPRTNKFRLIYDALGSLETTSASSRPGQTTRDGPLMVVVEKHSYRLFTLDTGGVSLSVGDMDRAVETSAGVTAAYVVLLAGNQLLVQKRSAGNLKCWEPESDVTSLQQWHADVAYHCPAVGWGEGPGPCRKRPTLYASLPTPNKGFPPASFMYTHSYRLFTNARARTEPQRMANVDIGIAKCGLELIVRSRTDRGRPASSPDEWYRGRQLSGCVFSPTNTSIAVVLQSPVVRTGLRSRTRLDGLLQTPGSPAEVPRCAERHNFQNMLALPLRLSASPAGGRSGCDASQISSLSSHSPAGLWGGGVSGGSERVCLGERRVEVGHPPPPSPKSWTAYMTGARGRCAPQHYWPTTASAVILSRFLYDATGRRVFSAISHLRCPCIPAPTHTSLASPSSALKTSCLTSRNEQASWKLRWHEVKSHLPITDQDGPTLLLPTPPSSHPPSELIPWSDTDQDGALPLPTPLSYSQPSSELIALPYTEQSISEMVLVPFLLQEMERRGRGARAWNVVTSSRGRGRARSVSSVDSIVRALRLAEAGRMVYRRHGSSMGITPVEAAQPDRDARDGEFCMSVRITASKKFHTFRFPVRIDKTLEKSYVGTKSPPQAPYRCAMEGAGAVIYVNAVLMNRLASGSALVLPLTSSGAGVHMLSARERYCRPRSRDGSRSPAARVDAATLLFCLQLLSLTRPAFERFCIRIPNHPAKFVGLIANHLVYTTRRPRYKWFSRCGCEEPVSSRGSSWSDTRGGRRCARSCVSHPPGQLLDACPPTSARIDQILSPTTTVRVRLCFPTMRRVVIFLSRPPPLSAGIFLYRPFTYDENTARQFRALRLAAMAHLMRMAMSPLSYSPSNAGNNLEVSGR